MDDSLIERGRRIKLAAELGLVQSSRDRHWNRALRHRLFRRKEKGGYGISKEEEEPAGDPEATGEGDADEAAEVERRVRALQRLIPGGEGMGVDRLLEETADYIEALQGQVSAMRALASFLDGLEKEQRMMGG